MQRFVDVLRTDTTVGAEPDASERSAIAISWEDGAPLTFSAGGPPQQAGEIAINQSLATQYSVGVGDQLAAARGWDAPTDRRPSQPREGRRTIGPDGPDRARVRGVHAGRR